MDGTDLCGCSDDGNSSVENKVEDMMMERPERGTCLEGVVLIVGCQLASHSACHPQMP